MRLIGDPTKQSVVEVYDGVSTRGSVCTDNWTLREAQIVCRHFGYERAVLASRIQINVSSNATRQKLIRPRKCLSSSTLFLYCHHDISTRCECSLLDAGVSCSHGMLPLAP